MTSKLCTNVSLVDPIFRFWFLVTFGNKIWKYYVIFLYIFQGKMDKMENNCKENHENKVTKIPRNQKTKMWDEQHINCLLQKARQNLRAYKIFGLWVCSQLHADWKIDLQCDDLLCSMNHKKTPIFLYYSVVFFPFSRLSAMPLSQYFFAKSGMSYGKFMVAKIRDSS